jgi:hypothetical protein
VRYLSFKDSRKVFIATDEEESLFLSWLITLGPFSLARSKIECCDSFDFNASLFVEKTVLKRQLIYCLIIALNLTDESCFIVLYIWLAACIDSLWYRTKKSSGHVVFLTLRISNLAKDSFHYLSGPLEHGLEAFAGFSVDGRCDPNRWKVSYFYPSHALHVCVYTANAV